MPPQTFCLWDLLELAEPHSPRNAMAAVPQRSVPAWRVSATVTATSAAAPAAD